MNILWITVATREKVAMVQLRVAHIVAAWQPGSLAARKWRENEKMKRKWRDNEEMER
jgi:hypothetical protein